MKQVKYLGEGMRRSEEMRQQYANKKHMARGGRIAAYPKMHAGADSGPGRLEKIRAYGKNAKP